jgi:hypothetical protein
MAKDKFKPTEGDFQILRGNYKHYATINNYKGKRICEVNIPADINDKNGGLAPIEEAQHNIKLLGASKQNYEALERIYKECCKAIEKSVVQGKRVNFKKLVGAIADCSGDAIRKTKNK